MIDDHDAHDFFFFFVFSSFSSFFFFLFVFSTVLPRRTTLPPPDTPCSRLSRFRRERTTSNLSEDACSLVVRRRMRRRKRWGAKEKEKRAVTRSLRGGSVGSVSESETAGPTRGEGSLFVALNFEVILLTFFATCHYIAFRRLIY